MMLFNFKDPWLIDYKDPAHGNNRRNRGMDDAIFWNRPSPFFPDYSTLYDGYTYKGAFLNQNQSFDPLLPNYSVKATSPQNIYLSQTGKSHNFYFQNWSYDANKASLQYPSSMETAVVFQTADAELSANLKGTQLSNGGGITNASQRNFLRCDLNRLHLVYSSMGHVWYERSTNNGSSWEIMNGGKPFDISLGSYPSIDYAHSGGSGHDNIVVTYLDNYYNVIIAEYFQDGVKQFANDVGDASSTSRPVIAYNSNGGRVLVVWNDYGLWYKFGQVVISDHKIQWYNSDPIAVPNTDQNSSNPTIDCKDWTTTFHLAWQQNWNEIKYYKVTENANANAVSFSDYSTISTGCGFPTVYYPSIAVPSTDYPKVVWIGSPYYGSSYTKVMARSKSSSGWSSSFGQYGSNVYSPDLDFYSSTYDIIVWSENNGASNKCFKNNGIKTLNTTGINIQICNAPNINSMYTESFKSVSLPYYFSTSNNLGSFNKTVANSTKTGRKAVVTRDKAEFYFLLGDVTLNNMGINFVDVPDSLTIDDLEGLNKYLITEPFQLDETSSLTFNLNYGFTDSSATNTVLTGKNKINFSISMIDNETGRVLGSYNDVNFDKNNLYLQDAVTYKINPKGIGSKSVRLKFTVDNNFKR